MSGRSTAKIVADLRDHLGHRESSQYDAAYYVEAADRLTELEIAVARYREHSILLNRVGWKIAEALGRVGPDDFTREIERPDQVIDELDELIAAVRP